MMWLSWELFTTPDVRQYWTMDGNRIRAVTQWSRIWWNPGVRLQKYIWVPNIASRSSWFTSNPNQSWWKHIAHLIMFLCAASASTDWECWCYVTVLRWCNQLSSLHLSLAVKTDTSSHSADNLSHILTKILTLILHSAALTQVWVSCCPRQPRASAHMLTSAAGWRWNLPGWREYSVLQWRVCSVASVFAGWN